MYLFCKDERFHFLMQKVFTHIAFFSETSPMVVNNQNFMANKIQEILDLAIVYIPVYIGEDAGEQVRTEEGKHNFSKPYFLDEMTHAH